VQGLTCREKDDFEESLVFKDNQGKRQISLKDASARLCSLCIRDENGKMTFSSSDIESLANKSGRAITRIYNVAEKLSGLGNGDVEEMVKNSEKTQTSDSN
jgi:hypothetical protein